jgi:hypothetical protein
MSETSHSEFSLLRRILASPPARVLALGVALLVLIEGAPEFRTAG